MMTVSAQGQGEIKGKILDEKGEGLIGAAAQIVDVQGKNTGQGGAADLDGNYAITNLSPGTYDVKVTYLNYQTQIIKGVKVSGDRTTFQNFQMKEAGKELAIVEVTAYRDPLVNKGDTKLEQNFDQKAIKNAGSLTVENIASQAAGVTQTDAGGGITINGGRTDEVQYIVNGHRVIGNVNVPTRGIKEIQVLTGGVSAKYGDATSGFVNITLNDAQQGLSGSAEAQTTKGLDKFGSTRAAANLNLPIVHIRDKTSKEPNAKRTLLGLSLSFQYQHDDDRSPSSIGLWQVKQSAIDNIRNAPLVVNPNGGFYNKAEFLTFADMYKTSVKPNNSQTDYTGGGELGIYPTKNVSVVVGGNLDYKTYNSFVREYALLNSEHNPLYKQTNYWVYGRLTQRIGAQKPKEGAKERTSGLRVENGYYTIQFDYEKYKTGYADASHGSNLFDYGYIGKFETQGGYGFSGGTSRTYNGKTYQGFVQNLTSTDTAVVFTPGTINPLGATFTKQYFQLLGAQQNAEGGYYVSGQSKVGYADNVNNIAANNGLVNGTRSNPIYDLWYNVGRQYNGYGIDKNDESYRGKVEGAFDIVKIGGNEKTNTHKIELGIEYEQRVQRNYTINPLNLWDAAKALVNTHLTLDTANPIFRVNGQNYDLSNINTVTFTATDSILYNNKATLATQTTFDRNLRKALGMDPDGTDHIDLFAQDPKKLNLGLFSADDLLKYTGGGSTSILSYYGYDYKGNVLTSQPTINDFFKAKDKDGNYTRLQGAFMPTYAAGYVQDKFFYKDLGFVIGLRIDRYDANQMVLKDPYSLYDTKKAGDADVKAKFGNAPGNIGSDYVVYVSDNSPNAKVTGYRNGDNWYDQYGRPTTGKLVSLQSANGLLPYLNVAGVDQLSSSGAKAYIKSANFDPSGSFTQYKAQYLFMPRLQFAFNITNKAQFFAHYDILSQRPQDRNQLNLAEYYYFTEYGSVKNNPNLKPIRKIDYEFGFKQQVADFAAVTLSAFYQETRNLIQLRKFQYAFPADYTTYDNIDFRSAKGFRLLVDLRRFHNFQLNANYTLQFVEGTGSDDNSQLYLINNNQPNFRSVYPVSTDARHQIKFTLDYRFDRLHYDGPVVNGYKILADFGINLGLNLRSGTPVRQSATVSDDASITGTSGRQKTLSLSSRLPWYTRLDLRVNKDFTFNISKKSDSKEARTMGISVYVYIQNLLNTENILTVYPYTLNPNDDGFLSANGSASAIASKTNAQSYKDLYRAKVNNPDNYSLPRRIYLGANINF